MSAAQRPPKDIDSDVARDERLRADLESLRLNRAPARPATSRRRWRPGRWLLGLVVVSALVLAGRWQATDRSPLVETGQSRLTRSDEKIDRPVLTATGYVVTGDRYVSIGVRVAGRITRYFVEEGQRVAADAPLVQLDDRDYRAAMERAESRLVLARANANLARAQARRGERLRAAGVISTDEGDVLDNKRAVAEAEVTAAEADLGQALVNLEYTLLRAPSEGVVLAKLKEVGEIAVPGGFSGSGDLVRLANTADMRAQVDVNESDLAKVRLGQPAVVTPDALPDARYPAEVVKLYPQVDRQKGTLRVEVRILEPDARLLPDMSARVTFLADPPARPEGPFVVVPSAAVRRDAEGKSFVWQLVDGRAHKVLVTASGANDGWTRLDSGLEAGASVVVGDATAVSDGARVRPAS